MSIERRLKPFIITWSRPWILWYAIGVHLMWALVVVSRPNIQSLVTLIGLYHLKKIGIEGDALAVLLVSVSILAAIGLLIEDKVTRHITFLFVLPQYSLMLLAILSSFETMIDGRNPVNGQPVDRFLILALVGPIAWAAMLHTASIFERYLIRWNK